MSGGVFQVLKAQGQEFFNQLASSLMSDPRFMRGMERAWQGKAAFEAAAARALKEMNIPTRSEFKRALKRIEALEARLALVEEAYAKPKARPKGEKKAKKRRKNEG